ncbi:MAG: hypothetical protein RJB05_1395 [Armatimonadota bacterium]
MDCQVVWNLVAPIAKRVALAPAFFRALERAVPIALDGSVLVIGLDSTVDGALQGALNSSDNLNILHKAFRDVTGLSDGIVRVIEGTTPADWANAQARDAASREMAARQQARARPSASSAGWDQAIDAVSALWQQCESRTSPVAKARFVLAAIEHIVGIVGTEGLANDADTRSLQRAVERIASCAQIDAVYVAAEVLKRI